MEIINVSELMGTEPQEKGEEEDIRSPLLPTKEEESVQSPLLPREEREDVQSTLSCTEAGKGVQSALLLRKEGEGVQSTLSCTEEGEGALSPLLPTEEGEGVQSPLLPTEEEEGVQSTSVRTEEGEGVQSTLEHTEEGKGVQPTLSLTEEWEGVQPTLAPTKEGEGAQSTLLHTEEGECVQSTMSHIEEGEGVQSTLSHTEEGEGVQSTLSGTEEGEGVQPNLSHTQEGEGVQSALSSTAHVDGINGASFLGAVLNLSATILGSEVMTLPAAMKVSGLCLGIAMIIIVAILTAASIELLLRFSRDGTVFSYGGVMDDAFGKKGKIILQICVVVNNIGVLTVYMIVIGDVLSGILEGWLGAHWWTGRVFILLITTLFVFVLLARLKRIDSLTYISALSVGLAGVFVVITAWATAIKFVNGELAMPKWIPHITALASLWKLSTVAPVLVTTYICHYNVYSIHNELREPSQIQCVVGISLALCTAVYITTSFFGYLLFGDSTPNDMLPKFDLNLSVPHGSLLSDSALVSYALHLILVLPIIFFSLRFNLDDLLLPSSQPVSSTARFVSVAAVLILIVLLGAKIKPAIWAAFQFIRAITAVCIGFIFPAAIAFRDKHQVATRWDKILSVVMIALAVFSAAMALIDDVYSILEKSSLTLANCLTARC